MQAAITTASPQSLLQRLQMPKLAQPKSGVPHLWTAIASDVTQIAAGQLQRADSGCVI